MSLAEIDHESGQSPRENHDHPLATFEYQAILDDVQKALPFPNIRSLLAESAINDPGTLFHQLRVYTHGVNTINELCESKLITKEVRDQTLFQFRSSVLHDIGKGFVGETLEKSKQIMTSPTYSATADDRTCKEQAEMASHAAAGEFGFNLFLKKGETNTIPKNVVTVMTDGMLYHHSSVVPIFSGRGPKVLYMDDSFQYHEGMSPLTNLIMNTEDIYDAMVYPREGRSETTGIITQETIINELVGLMRNERIESAFDNRTLGVENIRASLLKIVMKMPKNMVNLIHRPNIAELKWGQDDFIQSKDKSLSTLNELAALVWDRHGKEMRGIQKRFAVLYQEAKRSQPKF